MPPVKVESTPNPDSLKFTAQGASFSEEVLSFDSLEAAGDHELARALLQIGDVHDVFVTPQFVTVTKASDRSWEDLLPEVRPLIESHAGESG